MTPDAPLLRLERVTIRGTWGGREVDGHGGMTLLAHEGQLVVADARLAIGWRYLSDATLDRGALHLHRAPERLTITGGGDFGAAWAQIVAQACVLPEFASGLRTLGHSRGGAREAQVRFFGPILAARRRVANPESVERRVALFDARALSQRLVDDIGSIAAERHPDDAPRRRSLEAHLEEALEPCLAALALLQDEGDAVYRAHDGQRFVAWRSWTDALRRVFVEADRSWLRMAYHLAPR